MIAFLRGKVCEKFAEHIVLDVAGVGYEIAVTNVDYDSLIIDTEVKIFTYHHIREQSEELFGFSSLTAKKLFELLITVQGVGPKAGLAIMSLGDPETVRNAIANADPVFIAKASGVGKKTAEKVIIDLSDRVGTPGKIYAPEKFSKTDSVSSAHKDDAVEALISLGYTLADAVEALADVPADLPTEQRLKQALKRPKTL